MFQHQAAPHNTEDGKIEEGSGTTETQGPMAAQAAGAIPFQYRREESRKSRPSLGGYLAPTVNARSIRGHSPNNDAEGEGKELGRRAQKWISQAEKK